MTVIQPVNSSTTAFKTTFILCIYLRMQLTNFNHLMLVLFRCFSKHTVMLWKNTHPWVLQLWIKVYLYNSTLKYERKLSMIETYVQDGKELVFGLQISRDCWMIQMSRISVIQHLNINLHLFQKAPTVYWVLWRRGERFKSFSLKLRPRQILLGVDVPYASCATKFTKTMLAPSFFNMRSTSYNINYTTKSSRNAQSACRKRPYSAHGTLNRSRPQGRAGRLQESKSPTVRRILFA